MIVTEDKIKLILNSIPDPHGLLDKLAVLEVDRLVALICSAIKESGQTKQAAKQRIVDDLEESKDIFGNLNLAELLSLDDLLTKIYQTPA